MKRISQKAHPNLYEVLELFQREVTILQLEAGGARRQKRRKVIQREQKIKTLADEVANGDRDIDSYISAIRHCVVFDLAILFVVIIKIATMYISLINSHLSP